ncbi:MAG: hypothetical protein HY774_08715 [Acidobacteria bacterium]|nr:hypothetical protein [Acidobacteriota bacterium]
MSQGVFCSLGRGYMQASASLFRYSLRQRWFVQPFTFGMAVVYAPFLMVVACGFYLFVVFDWLGAAVDWIRSGLLRVITAMADRMGQSFGSFLFGPVVICLVAPIFLLSLFIPKLSSAVPVSIVAEFADLTGSGAFKTVNRACWKAAGELFRYVASKPFYVMPVLAIIAIVYSVILLGVGLCFVILIPLDWLSALIELTRQWIVSLTNRLGSGIEHSFGQFLILPVLLVVIAPVFLAVLLIPKFASSVDVDFS